MKNDIVMVIVAGCIAVVIFAFILSHGVSSTPSYGGVNQSYGSATSSNATSTTSATSSLIGATGRTFYVTDVTGSSDLAGAVIKVEDGSNIIWQDRISNSSAYSHTFSSPLRGTSGNSISVVVNGTAAAYSDVSGYSIP